MITNMMRRAMISDSATLSLDFTQMSTLADLTSRGLTFSRSTSGTYINASGLVATATAGNPRFDYDPSTLQPRGLLIEGSASNYLLNSDDYFGWASGNSAVADETGATAPDGTSTPDRISDNSTNGEHYRSRSPGLTTAGTYTMSVWFKNPSTNGRRYAGLQLFAGGGTDTGGVVAVWDFNTGAATSTTGYGGKGTPALVAATQYPNDWWKATLSITVTGTLTTINARILLSSNGTSTVYANGGTALGILAWGAQLETGSGASSYIPTGASTGNRASESLYLDGAAFSAFWPSGQSELSVYFAGDITRPPANTQFLWLSQTGSGGVGASRTRSFITTANSIRANTTVNDLNSTLFAAINTRIRTAVGVRSGSCALATNNGTTSTIVTNADTGLSTDATQLVFNPNADVFQHVSSLKFWPTRLSDAQLQALTT